MLTWIYNLFGTILGWFDSITGSYALALILYALMFKLLFLPFSIKQQKSQILMAKLRPKIAKIEKKYAGRNDSVTRQKMQQEIMEMQQKEGYSPLSGCLPLLLQFPIIIFLYNVIRSPLSYICRWDIGKIRELAWTVGFTYDGKSINEIGLISKIREFVAGGGTIRIEGIDIAKIPDFTVFGADYGLVPAFGLPFVLVMIPFLTAIFQWLSMFFMKKMQGAARPAMPAQDGQSKMSSYIMDLVFPLMSLWFAFMMPAMLGLYWIYQSILGALQQFILSKAMPLPTYTQEELREIERAERERQKAQKTAMQEKPRYKSLHYIDEEDYEELPTLKQDEVAEKKSSVGLDPGSLKDDRPSTKK